MRYSIVDIHGNKFAETNNIEYVGELMSDRYISTTIESPCPIDLTPGCSITYRNEKFTLYDPTNIKKQARANEYGKAFVYTNVKFMSCIEELKKCMFFDVTYTSESTNTIIGTLNGKFSFHATNVCDLASRILANLNRFFGKGVWQVKVLANRYVDGVNYPYYEDADKLNLDVVGKSNITVDINDITVYDALKLVYDTFGCMYVVDKGAKVIRICSQGNNLNNVFRYGKGNGLRSIERIVDSSALITSLFAYGSERNMPNHYYYNQSKKSYGGGKWIARGVVTDATPTIYMDDDNSRMAIAFNMPKGFVCKFVEWFNATLDGVEGYVAQNNKGDYNCYFLFKNEDDYDKVALDIAISIGKNMLVNLPIEISGEYIVSCPTENKKYETKGNPVLLPISCLMLPSFSENNLYPTIDDENAIAKYGRIEGVVHFDSENDEEGIEEIYPTITNSENKVDIGSTVVDDGIFDVNTNVPNFTITLRGKLGFDLNNTRPDGQDKYGTLCMLDGMCGGREFDIVSYNANTNTVTCKRTLDQSLDVWFPTCDFPINPNDSFVITDTEMPQEYIFVAAKKLEEKAKEYLAKHSKPKYTYNIDVDNMFMAKQHQLATEEESFYLNVKEGDIFCIGADADIELEEQSIVIDKLTIKESPNNIPQYSVTLRNEKKNRTFPSIAKSIGNVRMLAKEAKMIANTKTNTTQDDVKQTVLYALKNI